MLDNHGSVVTTAAGVIDLNGTATFIVSEGVVSGEGRIDGSIAGVSGGTGDIHPGTANTGILTVTGAVNAADLTLTFDAARAVGGTSHNQLDAGAANLAGADVTVALTGSYVPIVGTSLLVVRSPSAAGQIGVLHGPTLPFLSGTTSRGWKQVNAVDGARIDVSSCNPRPASTAFMVAGNEGTPGQGGGGHPWSLCDLKSVLKTGKRMSEA